MTKKIISITQAKGGIGKSVLTFLVAEKHLDSLVIDSDDATTSISKHLAYRDPVKVSFLDRETKRIDRSAFNSLFESVAAANRKLFIVDNGASVAEQLPKYFAASNPGNVREMLDMSGIELLIVCVVAGGNNFKATMKYLVELVGSVEGQFQVVIARNNHFPMSIEQLSVFEKYCHDNELESFSYDLVNDKGELAMRTAENVLQNGMGLSGLSPFKAVYFKGCVESIPL
ncbi:MAG: hypothetical protein JSS79_18125 [Bacteroidetes bacterium]|nr:hypothetical protein [Bacteroidota bacterium]